MMWGGQPQPTWGWSPNMNNDQEFDPSQGWAAAAALWAQQRQLQEQCQNGQGPPKFEKPPEPPGPPPVRPPLPPMDGPITPSVQSIEVHDYMHGKELITQTTEVIDYQHGKLLDPLPAAADYKKKVEENPAEWEVTSDNWQDHALFYNGGWTQDGWNGDQMSYYAAAAQHYQNEYNSTTQLQDEKGKKDQRSSSTSSGSHRTEKHQRDKQPAFPVSQPKMSTDAKMPGSTTGIDATEISRRAKVLPLWLRQGLEKMEQEKKKQLEKNKAKEDTLSTSMELADDKCSPKSTPDRENENNSDSEETEEKRMSIKNTEKSDEPDSAGESDEEDKERTFQQLMLKVKMWMTEILLGVTNAEIKDVCKEVYFELKRSTKAKATQLRRSGGLEALRSVGQGVDGDITTSESESEDEMKMSKMLGDNINKKIEAEKDRSTELSWKSGQKYNRENSLHKDDNLELTVSKQNENKSSSVSGESSPVRENCHDERTEVHNHKHRDNQHSLSSNYQSLVSSSASQPPVSHVPLSKSHLSPAAACSSSSENESKSRHERNNKGEKARMSDKRLKYYKKLALETRKVKQRKSSSSVDDDDNDDDSDESVDDSESEESNSTESEDNRQRKSKHRRKSNRSESSSPQRHKKKIIYRKDTSSDESDRGKRRKRKGSSTSSDSESSSSRRKRKSTSKKHKRRTKSQSKSPRSKRKR